MENIARGLETPDQHIAIIRNEAERTPTDEIGQFLSQYYKNSNDTEESRRYSGEMSADEAYAASKKNNPALDVRSKTYLEIAAERNHISAQY